MDPQPKGVAFTPWGKKHLEKNTNSVVKKTPYRETPIFENSENHLRKTQS